MYEYRTVLRAMTLMIGMSGSMYWVAPACGTPVDSRMEGVEVVTYYHIKKSKKAEKRKARIASLKAQIEGAKRSIANYEYQIEFYKFKISLHNKCRSCSAHCRPQGTGACRHWEEGVFYGKKRRFSHQLPRGEKRYSGIKRAVSALQRRVDGCTSTIERLRARIVKYEGMIRELEAAEDDD